MYFNTLASFKMRGSMNMQIGPRLFLNCSPAAYVYLLISNSELSMKAKMHEIKKEDFFPVN